MTLFINIIIIVLLCIFTVGAIDAHKMYSFKGIKHWKERRWEYIVYIIVIIFARILLFFLLNV